MSNYKLSIQIDGNATNIMRLPCVAECYKGTDWQTGDEQLCYHLRGGVYKRLDEYPFRFRRMAEIERQVGATCLKDDNGRIWLDELDPSRGDKVKPIPIQCGIVCEIEFADIMDERTKLIMQGKMSIRDVQ